MRVTEENVISIYNEIKNISQSKKLYEKGEAAIWYMLHCVKGQEEEAVQKWKQQDSTAKAQAFLFTFERMKRYEGSWHSLHAPLFPGMFFLESETDCVPRDQELVPVDEETEAFLRRLGGADHYVPMSRGIIRDGVTIVTEGPLVGNEARIRKIDRHRRLAKIEGPSELWQNEGFWTGLEITSKS